MAAGARPSGGRYTRPAASAVRAQGPTIELQLREATNLDSHPKHFHATTWHLVDATHMTQDWTVEGGTKGKSLVHLQFIKQE